MPRRSGSGSRTIDSRPGTQVFTLGFGKPVLGGGERATAVLLLSAWVINLAVAEYVLRRHPLT